MSPSSGCFRKKTSRASLLAPELKKEKELWHEIKGKHKRGLKSLSLGRRLRTRPRPVGPGRPERGSAAAGVQGAAGSRNPLQLQVRTHGEAGNRRSGGSWARPNSGLASVRPEKNCVISLPGPVTWFAPGTRSPSGGRGSPGRSEPPSPRAPARAPRPGT